MPRLHLVASAVCMALVLSSVPNSHATDPESLEQRQAQFKQLLADEWEYELRESPEEATVIGDYRYNDRWSDQSLAHVQVQRRDLENWLTKFGAVNTNGFSEQEQLSESLMVRNLKDRIHGIDLKTYEMPVDQLDGAQLQLAQFVQVIPFDTTKQYEDYLARLRAVPRLVVEWIGVLRQGEADKLMPPRYLLDKTVDQCKAIASPAGEANVFGEPVKNFPDAVPAGERQRLHDEILAAVDHDVRPAYNKLAEFIARDYAPEGRTEPGVWSLPHGDALYRFQVEQQTTTKMDPEAIHELGLKEVARIEGEELAIAKELGFSDLKAFRASMRNDPKLVPKSRQEIVDRYRYYIGEMQPKLPQLFGLLPKTKVEIRPVQQFREKDAPAAEYNQGTPDGSRPGIVYVNTGDYEHRSLIELEATAYHEGVPGHHMQISIAQTLPDVPTFRQQGGYTAYVEGWALYAERLGKDIGLYQDPYSDYGRLADEMLRAVRLVVDTGVHYKHWSRQQVVDYFHAHSDEDEPDVQAETDRYIVSPAQALGYKLGELEILKLRQRAQTELATKYDIRAFHDEILNAGALPLDVLDARVTAWINTQKAGE
jgi:uncharacterized protein (DUF885 family)